jgi:uncharacterized membrane protein
MFGQISLDILLLFMLYATGATTAAIACLYLLLRRGNAFADFQNMQKLFQNMQNML